MKSGFVLLSVLLILSLISGLILSQHRLILLSIRRQFLYAEHQHRLNQLDRVAERLIRLIQNNPKTLRLSPIVEQPELLRQKLEHGNDYQDDYRYLLSDLGDYPCIKLPKGHASHHWLLTLRDKRSRLEVLQIRVASAIADKPCLNHPINYHPGGLLTYRFFVFN